MMNQTLEHEANLHIPERSPHLSFPSSPQFPEPFDLQFEWQTDDESNSDCLLWAGDIDAALGFPEGAFLRTFSSWVEVLHPEDRDAVLNAIEAHLISGEPYAVECRARRFDGSVLRWIHSGHATRDADGNPLTLVGTLRNVEHPSDEVRLNGNSFNGHAPLEKSSTHNTSFTPKDEVSEIPATATEVSAEQARAQSLLRVAAHLNAQLDLQEVCEAICHEAGRTLGAPSAVMLFNKGMDAFVPTAVRGMPLGYEKRYIPTVRSIYDRHVAEMGTLFLFTDAQATPDLPNHKLYQEVNMRTIGIASLIREGEVLGLLKVYSFGESRTFNGNELALLQGLADIAAQSIANARLLAESERRFANIRALREIDKAILGSSDVHLALGVVLDQVVSRMGADASCALLLDSHTRTLRYAAGRGFRTNTPRRTDWQLGEGLAGRAALERRIIHVPDLAQSDLIAADFTAPDLKLPGLPAPLKTTRTHLESPQKMGSDAPMRRTGVPLNEGFVSYHGVPLVANGQVKGVLEMWHRSPFHLDEEDLEFLETLAGQAAIAVDNANLFRELQRSHDELSMAYDSTIAGWSGALDLRDKETEGHSQRVTRETLRLAREMGLDGAELLHIRRGALLHDIGKMGVPDAILLKPGPLSDEEWVVMKKHPSNALELLSPIEYLRPSLDIPYAHHEKWNGSGYPRGLSGDQIPLSARIFAVVDVWDALCSNRPYRKGWPISRVLNHIQEGAGSHFDPAVVEAFLRLHADEVAPESQPVVELPVEAIAKPVIEVAPEEKPRSWAARLFQIVWGSDS